MAVSPGGFSHCQEHAKEHVRKKCTRIRSVRLTGGNIIKGEVMKMPIENEKGLTANVSVEGGFKIEHRHSIWKFNAYAIVIMLFVIAAPILLSFFGIIQNRWIELIISIIISFAAIIIGVIAITKHTIITIRESK
jgi:hypothetical protein